MFLEHIF